MAWRAIQDTVGQSVSLASVSDLAERLYWRLLGCSDPWGRLNGHPLKLRALCFPMLKVSDTDAGRALQELVMLERIAVYQAGALTVVQILDFEENQPKDAYRKRGSVSKYPPPDKDAQPDPEHVEILWGPFTLSDHDSPAYDVDSGTSPEHVRNDSGANDETPANRHEAGLTPERVRGEGEGEVDLRTSTSPSALALDAGTAAAKSGATGRTRQETPRMIDINEAARRIINGQGWDEATSEDTLRETLGRLKSPGTLDMEAALELWSTERARRYPELAATDEAA